MTVKLFLLNSATIVDGFLEEYFKKNWRINSLMPDSIKRLIIKYLKYCVFNSKILNDNTNKINLIDILIKKFGNKYISNKEFILLYRGSEDGFTVNNHRNKCNGKYPTITLIKNDKNYIFGFYINTAFIKNEFYKKWGKDDNAFIFNIKPNKEIYPIFKQKASNAIIFHKNERGIIFWVGYNCLIHVSDYCNIYKNSFAGSNQSYDCKSTIQLCGVKQFTEYYSVIDIETFLVKDIRFN